MPSASQPFQSQKPMGLAAKLSLLRQTPSCVPRAVPHKGHLACSQAHFALPRAATHWPSSTQTRHLRRPGRHPIGREVRRP